MIRVAGDLRRGWPALRTIRGWPATRMIHGTNHPRIFGVAICSDHPRRASSPSWIIRNADHPHRGSSVLRAIRGWFATRTIRIADHPQRGSSASWINWVKYHLIIGVADRLRCRSPAAWIIRVADHPGCGSSVANHPLRASSVSGIIHSRRRG